MKQRIYMTQRSYFEDDVVFEIDPPEVLETLLNRYEEAARLASNTAATAVRSGKRADLRRAQWYEAITKTLEEVLGSFSCTQRGELYEHDPEEFDLPHPPIFVEI